MLQLPGWIEVVDMTLTLRHLDVLKIPRELGAHRQHTARTQLEAALTCSDRHGLEGPGRDSVAPAGLGSQHWAAREHNLSGQPPGAQPVAYRSDSQATGSQMDMLMEVIE